MKRTKPKLIGEILGEFFQRPYVARKIAEGKLPEIWQEVVGPHVANLTTSFRLENGILHVSVASSVVRQELFYRRDELMQQLNTRAGYKFINSIIVR